jgi:long-chain acyl-CoA synthetase
VVGQDRKQLGALVVPKTEILLAWAAGQPGAKAAARSDDPAVLRALKGELNRRLAARSGSRPDERLAGVALVEPFTIDNGLLTQTLKQRRDRITARDGAAIEAIYRGG